VDDDDAEEQEDEWDGSSNGAVLVEAAMEREGEERTK